MNAERGYTLIFLFSSVSLNVRSNLEVKVRFGIPMLNPSALKTQIEQVDDLSLLFSLPTAM